MRVTINKGEDPRDKMVTAYNFSKEAVKYAGIEVTIKEVSKKRVQEEKYHAMIGDIAKQVKFDGNKTFEPEVWKARLVEQFAKDKSAMGEPLRHDSKTVMSLDLQRIITVRPSTIKFTVKEASEFVEYLYSQGAEMSVLWSDPKIAAYEAYREAQS